MYLQSRVVVKYSVAAVVHMHTVSKESDTLMYSMKQSVSDLRRWAYIQQVAFLGLLSQMQVRYIIIQPHSRCSQSSMKHVIHFYKVMCLAELHAKCGVNLFCQLQHPGLCSVKINIFQTKQIGSFVLSLTMDVHARTELLHPYIFIRHEEIHRYFIYSASFQKFYELFECTTYLYWSAIKWSIDSNSIWNIIILVFYVSI